MTKTKRNGARAVGGIWRATSHTSDGIAVIVMV
jgi:hypothetical protein